MQKLLDALSPSPFAMGYIYFLGVLIAGEAVFYVLFFAMQKLCRLSGPRTKVHEVFKGIIERLMLSVGIAHGVPTVIIAFGALKVATKLSASAANSNPDEATIANQNAYFLIGNLTSILFAIIYALIARHYGFITEKLG